MTLSIVRKEMFVQRMEFVVGYFIDFNPIIDIIRNYIITITF